MVRIKRNDTVVVIAGAEKGKRGRVLRVDREKQRVLVEGINVRKKTHRRSSDRPQGGIDDVACPIHLSNVMAEATYDARRAARGEAPAAEEAAAEKAEKA
ncbi:MAG: 50S ribosomal protein L24 [Lentisphaeria bacterium]|nr:50S ribosomal protein L24 [Lentisphaeria bacterium]